jgi:hypothetical protein
VVRIDRTIKLSAIRLKPDSTYIILVILIAGSALRLAAPREFEFKADEARMVELVRTARATGELPWLGMPTSQGVRNPGMSVWPFVVLSHVFGADGFGLTQSVRMLNVLALAAAVAFGVWRLQHKDQRIWLAGVLLAAVNPLEVVLHRKLWAQSILPVIALLLLWLWVDRKRSWRHAAGLGTIAAVVVQIHPSGMFIVAALLAGALWDRHRRDVHWGAAALGFCALAWPLYFWVGHVIAMALDPVAGGAVPVTWQSWLLNVLSFRYVHLLMSNVAGVAMRHSLGSHFGAFVAQPAVLAAHLALAVVALIAIGRWFLRRCPAAAEELKPLLVWGLLGTGILMTVAGVFVQRHYYLGLFPLPYVAFALVLQGNKSWIPVYVVAALQLVVSVAFLIFIHQNGGAPGAEFGPLP